MSTSVEQSPSQDVPALSAAHARREVRRAREARTGFWRASIVSAFFTAVLIANLFVGAVVIVGKFRKEADTTSAKIGRAIIPTLDGVFCRYVLFDNRTSETKEDKISRCDDRDDARASRRSKTTFSWGGQ